MSEGRRGPRGLSRPGWSHWSAMEGRPPCCSAQLDTTEASVSATSVNSSGSVTHRESEAWVVWAAGSCTREGRAVAAQRELHAGQLMRLPGPGPAGLEAVERSIGGLCPSIHAAAVRTYRGERPADRYGDRVDGPSGSRRSARNCLAGRPDRSWAGPGAASHAWPPDPRCQVAAAVHGVDVGSAQSPSLPG